MQQPPCGGLHSFVFSRFKDFLSCRLYGFLGMFYEIVLSQKELNPYKFDRPPCWPNFASLTPGPIDIRIL